MTALNTDTNRVFETPNDSNAIPVMVGVKIYQGALVGRTENGHGRPLQAGDAAAGFAKDHTDNTNGIDGEKIAELKAKGKVSLFISGITFADVGRKVYASDDNTFTLTDAGNTAIGKLIRFEKADYGIVAFDFLNAEESVAAPVMEEPTETTEGE
jgi:hypothetical protein